MSNKHESRLLQSTKHVWWIKLARSQKGLPQSDQRKREEIERQTVRI